MPRPIRTVNATGGLKSKAQMMPSLTPRCDIPDTLYKERPRNVAAVRRGRPKKTLRSAPFGVWRDHPQPGKNCRFCGSPQRLILRCGPLTTIRPADYIPPLARRRCFGAMARLRSPSLFTR